jgi:hypothetical protein
VERELDLSSRNDRPDRFSVVAVPGIHAIL